MARKSVTFCTGRVVSDVAAKKSRAHHDNGIVIEDVRLDESPTKTRDENEKNGRCGLHSGV